MAREYTCRNNLFRGKNSGNIDNNNFHVFNGDIVLDEVLIALKEAKNGKAPGYDELPVEVLKKKLRLRYFYVYLIYVLRIE